MVPTALKNAVQVQQAQARGRQQAEEDSEGIEEVEEVSEYEEEEEEEEESESEPTPEVTPEMKPETAQWAQAVKEAEVVQEKRSATPPLLEPEPEPEPEPELEKGAEGEWKQLCKEHTKCVQLIQDELDAIYTKQKTCIEREAKCATSKIRLNGKLESQNEKQQSAISNEDFDIADELNAAMDKTRDQIKKVFAEAVDMQKEYTVSEEQRDKMPKKMIETLTRLTNKISALRLRSSQELESFTTDNVHRYESQEDRIRSALAKAERNKRYLEGDLKELKDHESRANEKIDEQTSGLRQTKSTVEEELQTLQEELEELEDKVAQNRRLQGQKKEHLEVLETQIDKVRAGFKRDLHSTKQHMATNQEHFDVCLLEIQKLEDDQKHNEREREKQKEEETLRQALMDEMLSELQKSREKVEDTQSQQKRQYKIKRERKKYKIKQLDASDRAEAAKETMQELTQQEQTYGDSLDDKNTAIDKMKKKAKQLEQSLPELEAAKKSAVDNRRFKEAASKKGEIKELETELEQLQSDISTSKSRIDELIKELDTVGATIQKQQESCEQSQLDSDTLKAELLSFDMLVIEDSKVASNHHISLQELRQAEFNLALLEMKVLEPKLRSSIDSIKTRIQSEWDKTIGPRETRTADEPAQPSAPHRKDSSARSLKENKPEPDKETTSEPKPTKAIQKEKTTEEKQHDAAVRVAELAVEIQKIENLLDELTEQEKYVECDAAVEKLDTFTEEKRALLRIVGSYKLPEKESEPEPEIEESEPASSPEPQEEVVEQSPKKDEEVTPAKEEHQSPVASPASETPSKPPAVVTEKSPESIPQESPKDSPRESSKESPRESPKESPRESPKESPRESPKESPKESPRESPRESREEVPEEESKTQEKVDETEDQKETLDESNPDTAEPAPTSSEATEDLPIKKEDDVSEEKVCIFILNNDH